LAFGRQFSIEFFADFSVTATNPESRWPRKDHSVKEVTHYPMKASFICLFAAALMTGGRAAHAAEYLVEMTSDWQFVPDYLEMRVGDTVTWVNHDYKLYVHNSACAGYWNTGYLEVDDSVSLTIPITGTFYYRDSNFYIFGMTGTIVVTPATPVDPTAATLVDPVRLDDGSFQFAVSNLVAGTTYIVQASTNLLNWTNLATNVAASAVETYVDTDAPVTGQRYYRTLHLR
jgi:plastocyanin